MSNNDYITAAKRWLDKVVIEFNLCPFAKQEFVKNRIHFSVSNAKTQLLLLEDLHQQLLQLNNHPEIETTLLIHPHVLTDFYDYNEFLDIADGLLIDLELDGIYQIASFHPDYQFDGTEKDDAENFSNRSPYPLLHILREASLDKAIEHYPDTDLIPERNIQRLNSIGKARLLQLFQSHFDTTSSS